MPKVKFTKKKEPKDGPKKSNKKATEKNIKKNVKKAPKAETKKIAEKPVQKKKMKTDVKKETKTAPPKSPLASKSFFIPRPAKSVFQKKDVSLISELSEASDFYSDFQDEYEMKEEYFEEFQPKVEEKKSDHESSFFEEEEFEEEPLTRGSSIESIESIKVSRKAKYREYKLQLERQKAEKKKMDFFQILNRVPDVDEISIEPSVVDIPPGSESSQGEEEAESVGSGEMAEKVVERRYSERSLSEFSFDSYSSEEEEVQAGPVDLKKVDNDALFELLVTMANPPVIKVAEVDMEALARKNELLQIEKDARSFLKELIRVIVETLEYVDPVQALRESLDKVKLFRDLAGKLMSYNVEWKINNFVEVKCCDYHLRKKKMRELKADHPDLLDREMNKFEVALNELNEQLGREAAVKEVIVKSVNEVELRVVEREKELKRETAALEFLIRKTLQDRRSEQFVHYVDKRIKEMSRFRKEFSKMRERLIGHLHVKGRLLEKIEALIKIGDDHNLREYELLMDETNIIENKLEERITELERARIAFDSKIHILAHMHDRGTVMSHTITVQKAALEDTIKRKDELRVQIHHLKVSRVRVQKQIRELSFQCGLIDKPELCRDFDGTVERTKVLKKNVESLRADVRKMEQRIKLINKE